jgi:glycosyltransferase involved in cell wall biosynthesis
VHFHGYDASKLLRSRRHVRNYRELFRAAAGVIAPSRFLADKLAAIGCPFEKLHVVPCGIDPSRFQPSSREPGRILAVGRLVEKKAPHLTIEAFAQIANRYPTARLEIIGDGPLRERCEALIDKFDLRPRVVLHGVQPSDRVGAEMRRASIFVQHSITAPDGDMEGLPVAILEAMASELPIVSTCHSGIPEAVEHGVTGYLVPEGDVNGMAEAMATLLTDPARAAAMGAAGRARVLKYFSLEHACDRLRSIMGLAPVAPPHVYTG